MEKKYRLLSTAGVVVITALLAAATIFLKNSDNDSLSFVLNFIFLIIMAFIVIKTNLSNLSKAKKISADLRNAAEQLKLGKTDDLFAAPELTECFGNYSRETVRLESSNSVCDIEDYINIAVINSVIRKNICEAVPGTMTGLGILGTFIGLIIGLSKFNMNYGQMQIEQMQVSIVSLLNGIKTAFLTSIYGVIFSLVFNFFYRSNYQDTVAALDEFYNAFHNFAAPNAQNEVYRKLIEIQEKHSADMAVFADKIIAAQNMQSENIRRFSDDVCNVMSVQFQNSIDTLNNSVAVFMDKAITSQEDKLRAMVREYLEMMNTNVLGGQLEDLRNVLGTISENEIESANRLKTIADDICTRDSEMQDVSTLLRQTAERVAEYLKKVNAYQNDIAAHNSELRKNISRFTEQFADYSAASIKLAEANTRTADSVTALSAAADDFRKDMSDINTKIGDSVAEVGKTVGDCSAALDRRTESLSAEIAERTAQFEKFVADSVGKMVGELDRQSENFRLSSDKHTQTFADAVSKTVELSVEAVSENARTSADIVTKLNAAILAFEEKVGDMIENLNSSVSSIHERSLSLLQANKDYTDALTKQTEESSNVLNRNVLENSETIRRNTVEMSEIMNSSVRETSAELRQEMQEINEIIEKMVRSVETSSKKLRDSLSDIHTELEESIRETFTQFESGTVRITQHFNSVISEMENNSDKMSESVSSILRDISGNADDSRMISDQRSDEN